MVGGEPREVDGLSSSIPTLCLACCRLWRESKIVMILISFYFIKPGPRSVGVSSGSCKSEARLAPAWPPHRPINVPPGCGQGDLGRAARHRPGGSFRDPTCWLQHGPLCPAGETRLARAGSDWSASLTQLREQREHPRPCSPQNSQPG